MPEGNSQYYYDREQARQSAMNLAKECGFSSSEEEYSECCSRPESICSIETKPYFSRSQQIELNHYDFIVVICITAVIGSLIFFSFNKEKSKKIFHKYSTESKAIVYGWLVWLLCVYSYEKMFDENVDYEIWLTLPPICVVAIFFWIRRFVFTLSNK